MKNSGLKVKMMESIRQAAATQKEDAALTQTARHGRYGGQRKCIDVGHELLD